MRTNINIEGKTITNSLNGLDGVNYGGSLSYLIQTTAVAANPTYSWTGTAEVAIRIASFKDTPTVAGVRATNFMTVGGKFGNG